MLGATCRPAGRGHLDDEAAAALGAIARGLPLEPSSAGRVSLALPWLATVAAEADRGPRRGGNSRRGGVFGEHSRNLARMEPGRLEVGRTATVWSAVTTADTAIALGSGDLPVLATPRLLAWLEAATCTTISGLLGPADSSVGTRVEVEHLAASAVGSTVTTTAELSYVDGRLLRFTVSAQDEHDRLLATGTITRVIVDRERFLGRLTPPS